MNDLRRHEKAIPIKNNQYCIGGLGGGICDLDQKEHFFFTTKLTIVFTPRTFIVCNAAAVCIHFFFLNFLNIVILDNLQRNNNDDDGINYIQLQA